MANWLEELKAGDEVVVAKGWTYKDRALGCVTKTTRTQVVVGVHRYDKATGIVRGDHRYFRAELEQATQEAREAIRREDAIRALESNIGRLRRVDRSAIPTETLEQIVASMKQTQG